MYTVSLHLYKQTLGEPEEITAENQIKELVGLQPDDEFLCLAFTGSLPPKSIFQAAESLPRNSG